MASHQSHGKYKQDAPAFKWRGKGVHAYTHSAEAAAYVAQCRQREIDKMSRRMAAQPILSSTDWCAFPPATSPYAPMMAGMARGLYSETVYVPSVQRIDLQKLAIAAARLAA